MLEGIERSVTGGSPGPSGDTLEELGLDRPGPALTGAETTRARSSARRTPAWPVRLLADRGMPAAVAGEVVPGTGPARVVGTHSGWR